MKVALHLACWDMLQKEWNQFSPLGLGYLVSYAKKYTEGFDFAICREFEDLIAEKPDLACLTYVTHNVSVASRQAKRIKDEFGIPVIVGGPHISTLPTVLDPSFDIAVLGEGEETFAELLRLWKAEGQFAPQSLAKVQGILFRDESGTLVKTPLRPSIKDLDSIPWPAREMMFEQWRAPRVEATIMTSRGCPYDCAFCSTVQHWGQNYRFPTNEYVIAEVEHIIDRYNPCMLHFYDDLFIVRRDRVIKLLQMMRDRGLHHGRMFTCFVRSNLVTPELMDAFAKTNFKVLHIGFESGSDDVLATFNKQAADMKKNRHVVEMAREFGIRLTSCFIFGAPGETKKDIYETFEFVSSSMDVFWTAHFSPLVILPGTEVWNWAKKCGVTDTHLDNVVLEQEDLDDMHAYYKKKWVYLNEDKIPREEFLFLMDIGRRIEHMVSVHAELQRTHDDMQKADYIASHTPIVDIVKAKTKRRLNKIMPTGAGIPFLS